MGHALWPVGCKSIEDVPAELLRAIEHANRVLDWLENLADQKEMPPEWMWPFEDELKEWFKKVDYKRREKYGLPQEDGDNQPPADEVFMMSNTLADERRARAKGN